MREYLRHLIAIPAFKNRNVAGTSSNGNVIVKDGCWWHSLLVHEISHTLDAMARPGDLGPNGTFSSSQKWQSEYQMDKHSISQYGMTSWPEDFADSGVIAMYDLVVSGGIPPNQSSQVSYDDSHEYKKRS
jgi:hypothetical protein